MSTEIHTTKRITITNPSSFYDAGEAIFKPKQKIHTQLPVFINIIL